MPKTRSQKEATVQILSEKLQKAKSVVLTDYQGLTMKDLSNLRDKLLPLNAEFTITKNSLLGLAIKQGLPFLQLEGPTATLFAFDDEISPIKVLVKAFKDISKGKVKSGLLGSEVLDATRVNQLAQLPTKDELRGKVVWALVTPLQGMVGVLQANLRNLVYALEQIRMNRSSFVPLSGTTADKEGGV